MWVGGGSIFFFIGRFWVNFLGNDCFFFWLVDLVLLKFLLWIRLEDIIRGGFWLDVWLFLCWGGLMVIVVEGYVVGILFEIDI